jgi:hypothetical protein
MQTGVRKICIPQIDMYILFILSNKFIVLDLNFRYMTTLNYMSNHLTQNYLL